MQAQSIEPLSQEKTLVDYCNEWLKQYRASYDVMDRICSSTKGNRYTLSAVTDVILCQDDDGEFYHFSLNMFNGAGEYFFEGPSLDISVNNIAMVGYLVSSIVDCYTKKHGRELLSDFSGKVTISMPSYLPSYLPASETLDLSDCFRNEYLSSVINNQIYYGNDDKFDDMLIFFNRMKAEDDNGYPDKRFIDSFMKSLEHSQDVLTFGKVKEK